MVCFFLSMNTKRKRDILIDRHPVNEFEILEYYPYTRSIGLHLLASKPSHVFFVEKNHLGRRGELSKQEFDQRCFPCPTLSRQKAKLSLMQFHRKIIKNKLLFARILPSQMLNINQRCNSHEGKKNRNHYILFYTRTQKIQKKRSKPPLYAWHNDIKSILKIVLVAML